eukprot:3532040-Prymnesium_polylepis.1
MKWNVSLKRAFMPLMLTEVVAASVSALAGGGSVLQMVQKPAVVGVHNEEQARRQRLFARRERAPCAQRRAKHSRASNTSNRMDR